MIDEEKLIQDRLQQVKETFGQESGLYQYLFETLDNFFYRYLETSTSKNLKTTELAPKIFGAYSFETSMLDALKNPNPKAKPGIIELAKRVPKDQSPAVRYGLWVEVKELTTDAGHLKMVSEINWGFPDYNDPSKKLSKTVDFKYQDFAVFRKELAQKLEEASELLG